MKSATIASSTGSSLVNATTSANAAGFLRDQPEAERAVVLKYRIETPATVHAPVRLRRVGGELVAPDGERRDDMFGHVRPG